MKKNIANFCVILLFLIGCGTDKVAEGPVAEQISHRGYNDNKLNGFISAIQDGFTKLEADVRLREEKPVLLHDNIPCSYCTPLVDLLELAQNNNTTLFLEFKEFKAIPISLELINKYNVNVVLTSFNLEHLTYINSTSNYSLGFITNEHFNLEDLPLIDYLIINQEHTNKCIPYIKCIAWDIKNNKQYNRVKYNVDFIIVDKYF